MERKKGVKKGTKKGFEITYKMEGDDTQNYDVIPFPKNHLKQGKIYNDFCVLNQEFLKYVISCKLTKNEYLLLLFLLSYMDKENKIIIDSEMIEYNIGLNKTHVNKYVKKLQGHKIIYKRNLGYRKGAELLLNFDIISPHMAFKNKNNFTNVQSHKRIMANDIPYQRQQNLLTGSVDLINPETGEIFYSE